MKRIRLILVAGIVALAAGVTLGWSYFGDGSPPGDWMPMIDTPVKRKAAYQKEQEWSRCDFTPIEDSESFRMSLRSLSVRLMTSIEPADMESLRGMLYEQLVARHTGSLNRYVDVCMKGRRPIIDDRNRELVERRFQRHFGGKLPEGVSARDIFGRLWREEYETQKGGQRFQDVCTQETGACIVIGDVSSPRLPMTLFNPEEQERWFTWGGAARLGSTEMFLSPRPFEQVLEHRATCKQADVVLVIRSLNKDVWCWKTQWYLDPDEHSWYPRTSIAICSRRRYEIPF